MKTESIKVKLIMIYAQTNDKGKKLREAFRVDWLCVQLGDGG